VDTDLDAAVDVVGDGTSTSGSTPRESISTLLRRPLVLRVVRYALGSVIASLVSLVTFVLVYGVIGGLTPRQSSVTASLVGMVPAYFLNRNWAWGRRDRSHFLKEVVPYLAASVLGLVAAMWSVSITSSHVKTLTDDKTAQVALVAMAYVGTYAALWVLKFLFFNVLFTRPVRNAPVADEPARVERAL
jgi:putative flippase GtrA